MHHPYNYRKIIASAITGILLQRKMLLTLKHVLKKQQQDIMHLTEMHNAYKREREGPYRSLIMSSVMQLFNLLRVEFLHRLHASSVTFVFRVAAFLSGDREDTGMSATQLTEKQNCTSTYITYRSHTGASTQKGSGLKEP